MSKQADGQPTSEARKERLAKALRDNLKRRKAQARERAAKAAAMVKTVGPEAP